MDLLAIARAWFNANSRKNEANNEEKKLREQLEKALADKGIQSFPISESMTLDMGWRTVEDEEVDVQKLFKENPNLFWTLCSVSKTELVKQIGAKDAAKFTRPLKKNVFKIDKKKTPVFNE